MCHGLMEDCCHQLEKQTLKLKLDKKVCWQTLSWLEVVLRAFKGF